MKKGQKHRKTEEVWQESEQQQLVEHEELPSKDLDGVGLIDEIVAKFMQRRVTADCRRSPKPKRKRVHISSFSVCFIYI